MFQRLVANLWQVGHRVPKAFSQSSEKFLRWFWKLSEKQEQLAEGIGPCKTVCQGAIFYNNSEEPKSLNKIRDRQLTILKTIRGLSPNYVLSIPVTIPYFDLARQSVKKKSLNVYFLIRTPTW
jgi:hypothetical protein